jgi:hypothetical protein
MGAIWKPNPATLWPFFLLFSPIPGRAKYLGDVDDVDDVPLIIVATPQAAAVYEAGNL